MTDGHLTCAWCGATVEADQDGNPPLGWLTERARARVLFVCPSCIRRHLRAIEGKLDHEWW